MRGEGPIRQAFQQGSDCLPVDIDRVFLVVQAEVIGVLLCLAEFLETR